MAHCTGQIRRVTKRDTRRRRRLVLSCSVREPIRSSGVSCSPAEDASPSSSKGMKVNRQKQPNGFKKFGNGIMFFWSPPAWWWWWWRYKRTCAVSEMSTSKLLQHFVFYFNLFWDDSENVLLIMSSNCISNKTSSSPTSSYVGMMHLNLNESGIFSCFAIKKKIPEELVLVNQSNEVKFIGKHSQLVTFASNRKQNLISI